MYTFLQKISKLIKKKKPEKNSILQPSGIYLLVQYSSINQCTPSYQKESLDNIWNEQKIFENLKDQKQNGNNYNNATATEITHLTLKEETGPLSLLPHQFSLVL